MLDEYSTCLALRLVWFYMENAVGEEYSNVLKTLLYINKDSSHLWTYSGAGASKLMKLIFQVRIPCVIANENEACAKKALETLSKSIVEAECLMEGGFADGLPSEYTDRCIKCIVELNRQKMKITYDLQYMIEMKQKREAVLKRKREEEEQRSQQPS